MCRKQPTPTDILDSPNLTEMDKLVFLYIRPRVRNTDWVVTFTHAKKEYVVSMKRWQCIFKASAFSELVNKDVKYFRKSLQRINDFYSKMDIEQKPYWYLISRLWYDELTVMDNERIMKGEWKDNERRANKSGKKEENEKSEKNNNYWSELIGIQAIRNEVDEKLKVPKAKVINPKAQERYKALRKTFEYEMIIDWFEKYMKNISERKPWSDYYSHRWSLSEFIINWYWLEKYAS